MSNNLNVPDTAPPSYEAATAGGSSTPHRLSSEIPAARIERNGIPPERRRSMEDENRPLPPGWVRSFDPEEHHQFFVDTTKDPPRSIWVHPYDDEEYLSSLEPSERQKLKRFHRTLTLEDLAAEDSDTEDHHPNATSSSSANRQELPPRPNAGTQGQGEQLTGIHKFGRKMKDKLTHTTHEQREQERRRRAEEERKAYMLHLKARQAMIKALETGEPQFLCKDAQGRDLYIVPPGGMGAPRGGLGLNPYASAYANPNVRYMRPAMPYRRPYGYGYGGGLGMPVAAGFLGGAMLGGLMF